MPSGIVIVRADAIRPGMHMIERVTGELRPVRVNVAESARLEGGDDGIRVGAVGLTGYRYFRADSPILIDVDA